VKETLSVKSYLYSCFGEVGKEDALVLALDPLTTLSPFPNHNLPGAYERFVLAYSPVWMGVFAVIIAGQLYESFTAHTYMLVCTTLCLPLFIYPFLAPALPSHAPPPKEASEGDNASPPSSSTVPSLLQGYPLKATAWLAIYSHIGNYWYTHYFYTVLGASYSMPSLRLNDVPLPLYFATFFYFSTYHALSNLLLRRVTSGYQRTPARGLFLLLLLLALSYCTAFMETLTISAFPYYSFQDPFMAFTVGSAFYGLYFLVSFPAFFRLDEFKEGRLSLYQSAMDALGAGMLILILLDAVRLWLNMPLTMAGQALRY
jgi:cycloeucalenol cycloisomerase